MAVGEGVGVGVACSVGGGVIVGVGEIVKTAVSVASRVLVATNSVGNTPVTVGDGSGSSESNGFVPKDTSTPSGVPSPSVSPRVGFVP